MDRQDISKVSSGAPSSAPELTDFTSTTAHNQLNPIRCALEQITGTLKNGSVASHKNSLSTPPESPTRLRPASMVLDSTTHDVNAITPPATPTSPTHFTSGPKPNHCSMEPDMARQGSISSIISAPRSPSIRSHPVALQIFDHESLEYVILVDEEDKKRPIGTGVWSDVYLAAPSTPKATEQPFLLPPSAASLPK